MNVHHAYFETHKIDILQEPYINQDRIRWKKTSSKILEKISGCDCSVKHGSLPILYVENTGHLRELKWAGIKIL